jgi:hypothetical protein
MAQLMLRIKHMTKIQQQKIYVQHMPFPSQAHHVHNAYDSQSSNPIHPIMQQNQKNLGANANMQISTFTPQSLFLFYVISTHVTKKNSFPPAPYVPYI